MKHYFALKFVMHVQNYLFISLGNVLVLAGIELILLPVTAVIWI